MTVPIQALIFDLDGTLVDTVGAVTSALNSWLPGLGAVATSELIAAWFHAEERHFPAWQAGEISFAEQRRRRLRDYLPLVGVTPGDDHDLDAIFATYLGFYERSWTKFGDVDSTLEFISKTSLKTAVLTNGSADQQNAKLRAVELDQRVGPVFTAEELGAAKPDPATYLTVCAELGVRPGSVLHIGDLHDLDVLAPRAAGLQALHLDRNGRGPHDEAHRITSLEQLPGLLPGTGPHDRS